MSNSMNDRLYKANKHYNIKDVAIRLGLNVTPDNKIDCVNPAHLGDVNSMELDQNSNMFKCFTCGYSGYNIDLVRVKLNITKFKAVEFIEGKFANDPRYQREYSNPLGITNESLKQHTKISYAPASQVKKADEINYNKSDRKVKHAEPSADKSKNKIELPFIRYSHIFKTFLEECVPIGKLPFRIEYFSNRNINLSDINKLGIKYLDDYHKISTKLKTKFSMEDLVESGLFDEIIDSTGIKRNNLIFKLHKIIIPFYNFNDIVFIQGLQLNDETALNLTKDIPIPFHFNTLRNARKDNQIFLTYGILDTLASVVRGYENTIGLMTEQQLDEPWLKMLLPYKIKICRHAFSIKNNPEVENFYSILQRKLSRMHKTFDIIDLQ